MSVYTQFVHTPRNRGKDVTKRFPAALLHSIFVGFAFEVLEATYTYTQSFSVYPNISTYTQALLARASDARLQGIAT